MDNTKKQKNKKKIAIMAVLLAIVLIIGMILAYLSNTTNTKTNVFSFADNIQGELEEPNWDAKDLIPGMEIRKDPHILNTSIDDVDEYAAIRIIFKSRDTNNPVLTNKELARLFSLIEIDWNTGAGEKGWTLRHGTLTPGDTTTTSEPLVFSYNGQIRRGEITTPLFNTVKVKQDISDEDLAWLTGNSSNHDRTCYTFGECDCEPDYIHHVDCSVPVGERVPDCTDCKPAVQHQADCASLVGELKANCGHIVDETINGFILVADGAVVQANDEFTGYNDTNLIAALKSLFGL